MPPTHSDVSATDTTSREPVGETTPPAQILPSQPVASNTGPPQPITADACTSSLTAASVWLRYNPASIRPSMPERDTRS